jgi:hypothetical protein
LVVQVMAGTWTSNNFLYKPAAGARGDDEKAKFDSGLNRVDSRLANEKWLNDPAYNGDFGTAVSHIGNAKTILSIPAGNWPIAANLTVPATLTVKFTHGASLAIPTGKTLTVNGPIEAQPYQIFSCTGTGKVVFGSQKVVYPEWWGAVINAPVTDCGSALNLAIAALPKGGVIEFQSGTYHIGTQVNLASDITFKGYGGMAAAGTTLQRSADVVMFAGVGVSMLNPLFNMNQIYRNRFTGIKFNGTPLGTYYTSDLFNLKACMNFKWDNCQFLNFGRALFAWELYDSRFTDCYFQWCGNVTGSVPVIELVSDATTYESTNNIYFTGCVFESNRYTCVKITSNLLGTSTPTNMIKFVNTKFDNTDLAGPTLDFLRATQVYFTNTFINVCRNIALNELVKFDQCDQIEGNLWLLISDYGNQTIERVMTINTVGGVIPCHYNLFLSGMNWNLIHESAAVKIDEATTAPWINIKTYGPSPGNAGYQCSAKTLTNYPFQSEALYGSSLQTYAPSGGTGDYMAVYTHGLAVGGPDVWINRVIESGPSTYMEWALNNLPLFRLLYNGIVQVITADLQIITPGKGVILTNAAGTVTKRVRLNDAGNGLVFEAP